MQKYKTDIDCPICNKQLIMEEYDFTIDDDDGTFFKCPTGCKIPNKFIEEINQGLRT